MVTTNQLLRQTQVNATIHMTDETKYEVRDSIHDQAVITMKGSVPGAGSTFLCLFGEVHKLAELRDAINAHIGVTPMIH